VGCGLHKYNTISEKRAKTLTILMKPSRDRRICGAMGRHQYDSKD
jgi:hypothetical protein